MKLLIQQKLNKQINEFVYILYIHEHTYPVLLSINRICHQMGDPAVKILSDTASHEVDQSAELRELTFFFKTSETNDYVRHY